MPEAIVARHMGIDVLGISCITNMAAGVLPQPLNHEEVLETARRVRGTFIALLERYHWQDIMRDAWLINPSFRSSRSRSRTARRASS